MNDILEQIHEIYFMLRFRISINGRPSTRQNVYTGHACLILIVRNEYGEKTERSESQQKIHH